MGRCYPEGSRGEAKQEGHSQRPGPHTGTVVLSRQDPRVPRGAARSPVGAVACLPPHRRAVPLPEGGVGSHLPRPPGLAGPEHPGQHPCVPHPGAPGDPASPQGLPVTPRLPRGSRRPHVSPGAPGDPASVRLLKSVAMMSLDRAGHSPLLPGAASACRHGGLTGLRPSGCSAVLLPCSRHQLHPPSPQAPGRQVSQDQPEVRSSVQ